MPYLLASCESNEAIHIIRSQDNQFIQSIGEDDDQDVDSPVNFKILTPYMQEKVQAISTVGWFAESLG